MIGVDPFRPDSLTERPVSELGKRIASAIVMAGVALLATWTGGWLFTLLWLAAACVILTEWAGMSRTEPRRPVLAIGIAGLLLTALCIRADAASWLPLGSIGAAVVALLLIGARRHDRLWASTGFMYAILAFTVPVYVRDHEAFGAPAILWIFAVVWLTDIGGFFVGRAFGGPKLAPSISPGKTWSGFAGGLLASTIGGAAIVWIAGWCGHPIPIGWPLVLAASVLASVAGQIGDLAESAMKRLFAVKDSGHIIPGHGGLMDRLDGFVTAGALLALILATSTMTGLTS